MDVDSEPTNEEREDLSAACIEALSQPCRIMTPGVAWDDLQWISDTVRKSASPWSCLSLYSSECDETGNARLVIRHRDRRVGGPRVVLAGRSPQNLAYQTIALIVTAGCGANTERIRQACEAMPLYSGVRITLYDDHGEPVACDIRDREKRMNLGRYIIHTLLQDPDAEPEVRVYGDDGQVSANDAARVADAVDRIAGEEPTR